MSPPPLVPVSSQDVGARPRVSERGDRREGAGEVRGERREGAGGVRGVIREQFATEVSYKEEELGLIEERIHLAKMMLQRLRLGVLAQHYGVAAFYPTALDYREETIGAQHNWEAFEEELMTKQEPSADSAEQESEQEPSHDDVCVVDAEKGEGEGEGDPLPVPNSLATSDNNSDTRTGTPVDDFTETTSQNDTLGTPSPVPMETNPPPSSKEKAVTHDESCFYLKRRVIVGNTSQYLDPATHHVTVDGATHKWMVYVRGPQMEPDISDFVKAVRFFLHPSYHPNDIVRVSQPPFHLTRLGWGEFPVRVQLEFHDKVNKSVDIIHNLVLDRTHTGQQTLGAETQVDLRIAAPPTGEGKGFRLNGLSTSCTAERRESETRTSVSSTPLTSTSPPSSSANSRPLSPDIQLEQQEVSPQATPTDHTPDTDTPVMSVLTTNLDKCLHNAVRAIPIYGKPNPAEDFYIPAPSLAQFKRWHVGRRRATEWERAVAIKRSIQNKLQVPPLLSTKQIMQWCRQNGYTPLDPTPTGGRGFCKVCGCQLEAGLDKEEEDWPDEVGAEGLEGVSRRCLEVHERCQLMMFGRQGLLLHGSTADPFEELHPDLRQHAEPADSVTPVPRLTSFSAPHELVEQLFSRQALLEEHARKQDEDVDVCAMPPSPSCARSRALVDMVPRFRVPQTPELKWVQQTAGGIGIHIYPAVIDRMYAHVVEHMIYISCARFLRGVLGQAIQGAGQMLDGKLSQDRILTPFHIQQAFLKLEHCDFLTNRYLGLQVQEGAGPEGVASLSGSGSSSGDSSMEEED